MPASAGKLPGANRAGSVIVTNLLAYASPHSGMIRRAGSFIGAIDAWEAEATMLWMSSVAMIASGNGACGRVPPIRTRL